jgi:hypothetical protein
MSYYTHRPFLQEQLDKLKPNAIVLELGTGDGSSLLMNQHCKKNKECTVLAFENNQEWHNSMKNKYSLDNYDLNYLQDWKDISKHLKHDHYDLVFVDQAPWEARIECINLLKSKTSVFIVHDYDYYNGIHGLGKYNCDDNSWWGRTYSDEFVLTGHYESLPPTLVMEKH